MFTKAILRKPGRSLVKGLRSSDLGTPDHSLALRQHASYVEALWQCGLETIVLEADEDYPDSVFIEDVALLTPCCAVITRPGAESRRGEIYEMKKVLGEHYEQIYEIEKPGTIEAGDIMMVGKHFFIGISERTNIEGARQMISFLESNGMAGSTIDLEKVLHLKTGVAYLENNNLLACSEFLKRKEFSSFNIIDVDPAESYAANCIWVNDNVLVPSGYPITRQRIKDAGYKTIEVDVSEFRKLDGGLSCLSLRF
ncbi:MAG TPA: N(G),N(G)-dimethylarginine dimethylaminohydrolase [Bacteroidales bacterium]|nr:N(G),N(G)-dimethylarginine dimethylaminohydrolase [Bacteroidales bacterium]